MKRHFFLSVLLLVSAMFFSACASDNPSDSNNGANSLPLGTIRVKLDGTLKTYTILSAIWSVPNESINIHAKDPEVQIGDIRIFIHAPLGQHDYPIAVSEEPGKAQLQLISIVNNNATGTLANTGTINVSKLADNEIAGTFNFTSTISGTGSGPSVVGTDGEFHLSLMKI